MTLYERDYLEVTGFPGMEIVRVQTNQSGDSYTSKKFHKIKSVMIQNHGATFATGVAVDAPKVTIMQGGKNTNAKVFITHTSTAEVFSLNILGEY